MDAGCGGLSDFRFKRGEGWLLHAGEGEEGVGEEGFELYRDGELSEVDGGFGCAMEV